MEEGFSIRAAQPSDLEGLLALYQHLNPSDEAISLDLAASRLDGINRLPGSAVMLGLLGAVLVASCTLIVIPNLTHGGKPYALIENVVTDARYRGRGYGTRLLNAAVQAAWGADCYKVMLLTGSKQPSTLGFYESAGFEQSKTGFQMRRMAARHDA
ncbi:MAG: GNAT family N-acetyltransferase [Roseomonas sp.]|jgi:GNAT superfamily N-acetyltransferase|nr:GNAT family N-acetyltransferase [Roseomonas sp.]MCA3297364.1 GNAT family N-acetyltransferase [Roseomonas sp.]